VLCARSLSGNACRFCASSRLASNEPALELETRRVQLLHRDVQLVWARCAATAAAVGTLGCAVRELQRDCAVAHAARCSRRSVRARSSCGSPCSSSRDDCTTAASLLLALRVCFEPLRCPLELACERALVPHAQCDDDCLTLVTFDAPCAVLLLRLRPLRVRGVSLRIVALHSQRVFAVRARAASP